MGKIDEYKFSKDGITFYVNFPPDRNLKKQVENLFSEYDLYVHMKDFNTESIKEINNDIIETIYSLGIYKITQSDNFSSNSVTLFEDLPKESFLRLDLIEYFHKYKNDKYRVGLVSVIDNINKTKPTTLYIEWLPRMLYLENVFSIPNWDQRYDILCCNIIQHNNISYFVLFEMKENWEVVSYVTIGDNIFNKNSINYLNRTKMLQINSMSNNLDDIFNLWSIKYNERRHNCGISYLELTFYDMLIYLYQLQEFVNKVEGICKTNILLWTNKHNEFNNEFRDFKFIYDSKNRAGIINAFNIHNETNKENEVTYAFINDFFYKDLII